MRWGYAPANDQSWIAFKSETAVPACGVVEAFGANSFGGQLRLIVAANQSMGEGPLFINGPQAVAGNGHGVCSLATSVPQWALWDEEQTEGPTCGVQMGPRKGSFKLSKGVPGYIALGHTIGNRTLVVRNVTGIMWRFALQTPLTCGGEATAHIMGFDSDYYDTGATITVCDPLRKFAVPANMILTSQHPRGWCKWAHDRAAFEIVNMQLPQYMAFACTNSVSKATESMTVSVTKLFGDLDQISDANVTVHNNGFYGTFLAGLGTPGTAFWSVKDSRWEVIAIGPDPYDGTDFTFVQSIIFDANPANCHYYTRTVSLPIWIIVGDQVEH